MENHIPHYSLVSTVNPMWVHPYGYTFQMPMNHMAHMAPIPTHMTPMTNHTNHINHTTHNSIHYMKSMNPEMNNMMLHPELQSEMPMYYGQMALSYPRVYPEYIPMHPFNPSLNPTIEHMNQMNTYRSIPLHIHKK